MQRLWVIIWTSTAFLQSSCLDFREDPPKNLGTMAAVVDDSLAWSADEYVTARVVDDEFWVHGKGTLGDVQISIGNFHGPDRYDIGETSGFATWETGDNVNRISGNTIIIGDGLYSTAVMGLWGTVEINQSEDSFVGTFQFDAVNQDLDTLGVSEGSFEFEL